MTAIPNDLAEDLLLFLQKHALSPQTHASEAEALMVRLEICMETPAPGDLVRLAAQVTAIAPTLAPPAIVEALAAAVAAAPPDPLAAFEGETARDLANYIMKRTGLVPVLTTSFDPGTKHRAPTTFDVLRFWMRDRDGMLVTRDLDLREYHPREGVKHALRSAARTAGLDHFGAPLTDKPESELLANIEDLQNFQITDKVWGPKIRRYSFLIGASWSSLTPDERRECGTLRDELKRVGFDPGWEQAP